MPRSPLNPLKLYQSLPIFYLSPRYQLTSRTVLFRIEKSPNFRKPTPRQLNIKQQTSSQKTIIYLASRYIHGVTANQIYTEILLNNSLFSRNEQGTSYNYLLQRVPLILILILILNVSNLNLSFQKRVDQLHSGQGSVPVGRLHVCVFIAWCDTDPIFITSAIFPNLHGDWYAATDGHYWCCLQKGEYCYKVLF